MIFQKLLLVHSFTTVGFFISYGGGGKEREKWTK